MPTFTKNATAERHDQMERELMRLAVNHDTATDTLHHYTNAAGLLGMIENKEVWATHFRYVNDKDELLVGEREINNELEQITKDMDPQREPRAGLAAEVLAQHRERPLTSLTAVYLASFSEVDDDLSQWRAYGSDGNGYSVGVRTVRLPTEERDDAQMVLSLRRCEYKIEAFRRRVRDTIFAVADGFEKYSRTWSADTEDVKAFFANAVNIALRLVAMQGPTLKHAAFYSEKEWRLVAIPMPGREAEVVKYRAGRRGVTPYLPVALCEDDARIDLGSICIGPMHDPEAARQTIRGYLTSKGYPESVEVKSSEAPYRG